MYAILVKNNEAYDVIGFFSSQKENVMSTLDSAYATGLPITAIEASAHKQSALYGATWNGSSFSGGTAGPNLMTATQEQLDSFDLYAFLKHKKMVNGIPVFLAYAKGMNEGPIASITGANLPELETFFAVCMSYKF